MAAKKKTPNARGAAGMTPKNKGDIKGAKYTYKGRKPGGKLATGAPQKYATPADMQVVIDKYFAEHPDCACGRPPTRPGLALALDFDCPTDWMQYCMIQHPEFAGVYKRTITLLQDKLTTDMIYGGKDYATGLIFCMCNWFRANEHDVDDYQNPQRIEITGAGGGAIRIEQYGNALKKAYGRNR